MVLSGAFSGSLCSDGEVECPYAADGCVGKELIGDGIIDCMRDGWDEGREARNLVEDRVTLDGNMSLFLKKSSALCLECALHIVCRGYFLSSVVLTSVHF